MSDIIKDLEARGLVDSFSDEEKIKKLLETKQTIYCGFDPSNKSLQLGNFIMITLLRRLQKQGHRIIALVGGATGMIGDPSGKKAERNFLTVDAVKANAESIKNQLAKYLDFSSPDKGIVLNNYDWWSKINVIEFLRDYGKLMPINYMLAKEIVKSRLAIGISYTEFSYMILQSGDFYRLHKDYSCNIQIGGGDQWGNLTTALDFVKRKEPESPCQVFSVKLITDSNGKKFGKSEKGALFLDPSMTSPFTIYQYFINVSDSDVLRYLYIFDDRPLSELDAIYKKHMENPGLRYGQKELAYSITCILHGKEKADACVAMTKALFDSDFSKLSESECQELAQSLSAKEINSGTGILDALVLSGLASSKREAREFIKNGAISLNGTKISDEKATLSTQNGLFNRILFLKRGKRQNSALFIK